MISDIKSVILRPFPNTAIISQQLTNFDKLKVNSVSFSIKELNLLPATFIVRFSCSIPWSTPVATNEKLDLLTLKLPSLKYCQTSGSSNISAK